MDADLWQNKTKSTETKITSHGKESCNTELQSIWGLKSTEGIISHLVGCWSQRNIWIFRSVVRPRELQKNLITLWCIYCHGAMQNTPQEVETHQSRTSRSLCDRDIRVVWFTLNWGRWTSRMSIKNLQGRTLVVYLGWKEKRHDFAVKLQQRRIVEWKKTFIKTCFSL